jgi:hypothetical protein
VAEAPWGAARMTIHLAVLALDVPAPGRPGTFERGVLRPPADTMHDKLAAIRIDISRAHRLQETDAVEALDTVRQARELLGACPGAEPADEVDCLLVESSCHNRLSKFDAALPIAMQALDLAR